MSTTKRYRLSDLKLGMRVCKSELSQIYDTYIILVDVIHIADSPIDIKGTIGFIGKELNSSSDKLFKLSTILSVIYFAEFGENHYNE